MCMYDNSGCIRDDITRGGCGGWVEILWKYHFGGYNEFECMIYK